MPIDPQYLTQLELQHNLPPGLLSSQIQVESSGDPNALNTKTANGQPAIGLAQFQPATAAQYGIDPTDPYQSADGMARYDADNLKRFGGDLPSALAAYNWGPTALAKNGLQNAPEETQKYINKVVAGLPQGSAPTALAAIGNFIMPSAQAAETSPSSASNPYDHLSDEELLAEAKKQGISLSQDPSGTGAQPWTNLPADQQVQTDGLPPVAGAKQLNYQTKASQPQVSTSNPYDNMSDEQLLAEAKKQGISIGKQTGLSALLPEWGNSATEAGEMMASGAKRFYSGITHPLSQAGNVALGPVQSALGALGMALSPADAVFNAFVANPVENKTGIPAGVTNFAATMLAPYGIEKGVSALAKLAPEAKVAESALGAMGAAEDPGTINVPPGGFSPQAATDVTQAASQAAPEVTGSTVAAAPIEKPGIPMTAGQATQNPELQRFEADAMAGAKGSSAEASALDFNEKQQAAVSDLLKSVGDYKEGGNPADSIGKISSVVKSNAAIANNGVDAAYDKAYELSDGLPLTRGDMKANLLPQVDQFAKDFRIKKVTTPKAYDALQDLKSIAKSNKASPLLEDGETWRRSVTNLAANTTDPADAKAMRGLIGKYDGYMGDLADRLSASAVTPTAGNAKQADAINAFKEAVASRREYGRLFEGNDFVENLINGNKSIDDLTKDLLGSGKIASKQGQLDNLNGILRASGQQAQLVKAQMQNAYAQRIYDTVAGSKIAGTTRDSLSLPKLQTALENTFRGNRQFATGLFGSDAVANAEEAIKQLDLINSRQANVGNVSSSGYTLARLGGYLSHVPGLKHVVNAISGAANLAKEGQASKDAAEAFKGVTPKAFSPTKSGRKIPLGVGVASGKPSGTDEK